jgi:hypothetical protein
MDIVEFTAGERLHNRGRHLLAEPTRRLKSDDYGKV